MINSIDPVTLIDKQPNMSIEEQFDAAVKVIQSLPKDGFFQPSNEMKLRFYAFFKQATEGPNTTSKPAFYDIVNRYKWDAWKQCGNMSRDEAMRLYVEELKKVIETISVNHEVSEFLNVLGPFYEFLPDEITQKNQNNNNDNDDEIKDKMMDSTNEEDNQVTTTTNEHPCFITYDSDGDEFTDTFDMTPKHQIPIFRNVMFEEENIQINSVIDHTSLQTSSSESNGHENQNVISSNQTNNNNNVALGFNEQLAAAIFQLQHSIERISDRVNKIEIEQTIKSKIDSDNQQDDSTNGYWPFRELSPKTTIFLLSWPMIVFFVLNYLKRLRRK